MEQLDQCDSSPFVGFDNREKDLQTLASSNRNKLYLSFHIHLYICMYVCLYVCMYSTNTIQCNVTQYNTIHS